MRVDLKKKRSKKRVWRVVFFVLLVVAVAVAAVVAWLYSRSSIVNAQVVFDRESGFYDDTIELSLKVDGLIVESAVDILYNLNGDDLYATGDVYDGSIELRAPETGYQLYTVSAMACNQARECGRPVVRNYVVGNELEMDITLKVININCSA